MRESNDLTASFVRELAFIQETNAREQAADKQREKIHVLTTGAGLTTLYESLRNASENAEENLQLAHAIRRFFKRIYLTPDSRELNNIGESLITELTLAGYLENDSVSTVTAAKITKTAQTYTKLRQKLLVKFPHETVNRWTLEPMSAAIEAELRNHQLNVAFADLCYNYFLQAIDAESLFGINKPPSYEAILFVAVQQTILKSDPAAIRLHLVSRYQTPLNQAVAFAKFNVSVDQIFANPALDKLNHLIDRNSAPFRILLKAMWNDDKLVEHLDSEKAFLGPFNAAIGDSYTTVNTAVNRGIVRSVIFLIITKFIIGVAIEVPYDLWIHGGVQWLPLTVNLLLPPIYMVALRLTLLMPDARNTRALNREISRILFSPVADKPFISSKKTRTYGRLYNFLYTMMVLGVFVGVGWLLWHFAHFEWIHLVIFFLFISTASFLGFRLSRKIREIEVGDEAQTSVTMLRDFLYMPFVAVGRRINETYSKINIVSHFLDMFVELPLKTIISFVRRWGSFLSAKKDDL